MVYKRYYSPFDEPTNRTPASRRQTDGEVITPKKAEPPESPGQHMHQPPAQGRPGGKSLLPFGFLNRIGNDDLLLIGVLILLLTEEKEHRDVPLILTIGFLLLIEYIDGD